MRKRRHRRVRSVVSGTAARPRICVSRSIRGMYVQLIDDSANKTLAAVSSKTDAKGDAGERTGKVAQAYLLGKAIAEKAKAAGIESAVFDRAGYLYHGRVRAVAEGAREAGLNF